MTKNEYFSTLKSKRVNFTDDYGQIEVTPSIIISWDLGPYINLSWLFFNVSIYLGGK